ncbi:hypothetical protein [Halodesulfovibrio marinisediminis]|uniref:Uncharacterized protein n=1 Tax=Halodesulfovibrio marinisediminis DSM 17456 TaxID=1121457 RepID=A0A1N6DZU6_9BACT|nr:hypothetical protein [Halodesulfovibrio marinisediminis]SIN76305.1 hypothetical protein SAMN02745161_0606 [Halodesulfovibrio marinisediminis DSM 17456]
MRLYLLEDFTGEQIEAITGRLNDMELAGAMDGIYWLPCPQELLSDVQKEHTEECGPHCMALEVDGTSLRMELLVRARNKLRCECVSYASEELRAHMIKYMDEMLTELNIYV